MKSTLTASHLIRHFLLFVMTVVFLLTMTRAAYALWQFQELEATNAFIPLFVEGLRFDLALIGMICLIPAVLGSLLSIVKIMRVPAKLLINTFLFGGLMLILVLELITPWFIDTQGVRPDLQLIQAVEDPIATLTSVVTDHLIPVVIGSVLSLLILVAFWSRMEIRRFLRYRTSAVAGLTSAVVCGLLCVLAIWSKPDVRQAPFGLQDAQISDNATVNDLTLNTPFKTLHTLLLPYID